MFTWFRPLQQGPGADNNAHHDTWRSSLQLSFGMNTSVQHGDWGNTQLQGASFVDFGSQPKASDNVMQGGTERHLGQHIAAKLFLGGQKNATTYGKTIFLELMG